MLKHISLLVLITMTLIIGCNGNAINPESQTKRAPESEPVALPGLFSVRSGVVNAASGERGTARVEDVLEMGLSEAGASPTHLAFLGTVKSDSVRCNWRGVARTMQQREAALRFWLSLDGSETLPSPADAEVLLMADLTEASPAYLTTLQENFRSLARGGATTNYQFLTCYVDINATEYLLGAGPSTLTVAYDRMGEGYSYDLYQDAHTAGEFGTETLRTEQEHQAHMNQRISDTELLLGGLLEEDKSLFFLAPMGSHHAVAVEAWQVIAQWRLETDSDDTVHAIRFGSSPREAEYSQTLSNLRSRITTAATTDAFAGKRIANISGLNQYYRDIGAYGDITPGDGSEDTFTPDTPPPSPICAGSTAVGANPGEGLLNDCNTLIAVKDNLAGTATLNWNKNLAMSSWDGITTGGSPQRVTAIELTSRGLTGNIPQVFTRLSALSRLKLSGNTLTGCIPGRLRQVPTHDLDTLGLRYCDARAPSKIGLTATQVRGDTELGFSWQIPEDGHSPITGYQLQLRPGNGEFTDWSPAPTTELNYIYMPGLAPGTTYRFRIRAINAIDAGKWSDEDKAKTTGNQVPIFPNVSYGYDIYPDTAVGDKVGGVSATLPSGDPVTYALSTGAVAGPERYFNVNSASGNITLASALNYPEVDLYPIVVKARAPDGGESSVPVFILVKPRP